MAGVPNSLGWPKLVLASASPRRRQLLELLGADFSVRIPKVDESLGPFKDPARGAVLLAERKARSVAASLGIKERKRLVLAADTVVCYRHHVLGKPTGPRDARRMLRLLSGHWHQVITGMCLLDPTTGRCLRGHEMTRVRFRKLGEGEVMRYIRTGEPKDKAGAYGIQGLGALLVDRVDGCFYNVIGLPLAKLNKLLRRMIE